MVKTNSFSSESAIYRELAASSASRWAAQAVFIQLLPSLLSTIKRHRLPQVTSSLKVKRRTYAFHSQPSGSLKEVTLTPRATTVLGSFPCSIDAGSSKRSASVLSGGKQTRGFTYSATYFSATGGSQGMGTVCRTLGSQGLGFQESETWWDQQVLCPVPHLQAAGFPVTVCSHQGNGHFRASVPDYKSSREGPWTSPSLVSPASSSFLHLINVWQCFLG